MAGNAFDVVSQMLAAACAATATNKIGSRTATRDSRDAKRPVDIPVDNCDKTDRRWTVQRQCG